MTRQSTHKEKERASLFKITTKYANRIRRQEMNNVELLKTYSEVVDAWYRVQGVPRRKQRIPAPPAPVRPSQNSVSLLISSNRA